MAAIPPGSATEGRPVSTRCWDRLVILVTAPVRPKQASPPSGLAMHGPAPPEPDSATYRAPSGPNAIPRGLSSPLATTFSPPPPPEAFLAASAMACDGLLALVGAAVAAPPRAA